MTANQYPHEWGPSRVGHGEAQCRRCLITNREAAVIGAADCERHPLHPDVLGKKQANDDGGQPDAEPA